MKKIALIIFASIIAFACSKDDKPQQVNDYGSVDLYLDIFKSDGTPFEAGEILRQYITRDYEDNWMYVDYWLEMPKVTDRDSTKWYFGPTGYNPPNLNYYENIPNYEIYSDAMDIIKYLDTDVIDTLYFRERLLWPNVNIEVFLNGILIDSYVSDSGYYMPRPWVIEIAKDEF